MRAVIVCESMFGSTKKVAEAIAGGLADCAEVSVVPVTSADTHILDGADLVVVGGPTHTHGMSRPSTRKMAGKLARKPGSEVELVPGAVSGPGVREEGGNGSSPGCTYTVTSHMSASSEAEPAWSGCTCVSTIARGRAPTPNRVSAALGSHSRRLRRYREIP